MMRLSILGVLFLSSAGGNQLFRPEEAEQRLKALTPLVERAIGARLGEISIRFVSIPFNPIGADSEFDQALPSAPTSLIYATVGADGKTIELHVKNLEFLSERWKPWYLDLFLVHELVHAYQIRKLALEGEHPILLGEARTAQVAALEGHAQYVTRHIAAKMSLEDGFEDWTRAFTRWPYESRAEYSSLESEIRNAYQKFVYSDGLRFFEAIAEKLGPKQAASRLISHPPNCVRQVTEPHRYGSENGRPSALSSQQSLDGMGAVLGSRCSETYPVLPALVNRHAAADIVRPESGWRSSVAIQFAPRMGRLTDRWVVAYIHLFDNEETAEAMQDALTAMMALPLPKIDAIPYRVVIREEKRAGVSERDGSLIVNRWELGPANQLNATHLHFAATRSGSQVVELFVQADEGDSGVVRDFVVRLSKLVSAISSLDGSHHGDSIEVETCDSSRTYQTHRRSGLTMWNSYTAIQRGKSDQLDVRAMTNDADLRVATFNALVHSARVNLDLSSWAQLARESGDSELQCSTSQVRVRQMDADTLGSYLSQVSQGADTLGAVHADGWARACLQSVRVPIPVIAQAAGCSDSRVRFQVMNYLATSPSDWFPVSATVRMSVDALADISPAVARCAARILATLGHEGREATQALQSALGREAIRSEVIDALGAVGTESQAAVRSLTPYLNDRRWRVAALRAMQSIGCSDPAVVSKARVLLGDPSLTVQSSAAGCLVAMGKVPPGAARLFANVLASHAENESRVHAARSLGLLGAGAKPALPELRAALRDRDAQIRLAAVSCFAELPELETDTVVMLASLLNDPDDEIRLSVPYVLADCGSNAKAALPSLLAALEGADELEFEGLCFAISSAGKGIADDMVLPEIRKLMRTQLSEWKTALLQDVVDRLTDAQHRAK